MKWIRIDESEDNKLYSKVKQEVLKICDNIKKQFTEYEFKDSRGQTSYASSGSKTDWLYEYVPEIYRSIGFGAGKLEDRGYFEYWHGWNDYSEFERRLEDFKKNRLEECVDWICAVINQKRKW